MWQFCQEKGGDDAEVVVRCRPDLWFRKMHMPSFRADNPQLFVPYWGGYGGINDRFAVMSGKTASAYFNAFNALPYLLSKGCPFHPETLLSRAAPVATRTLRAEFCTVRMPNDKGEMTLVEPDFRPGDIFDYLADLRMT